MENPRIHVPVPCPFLEQPLTLGLTSPFLSPLHIGHPQPKVTWFKDGRPLAGGDAHHVSPDGALLQVLRANLSSAGHYSCVAANAVGEKSKHFQLSVLGECWASPDQPGRWPQGGPR